MPGHVDADVVVKALRAMLNEAFAEVKGSFLDKNTSILETLDGPSASEVSKPISAQGTSIAAHVNHLNFYLDEVLYAAEHGQRDIDWDASWQVERVSDEEWANLKSRTRRTYEQISQLMESLTPELITLHLGGAISVIAHAAYHLGAIRQIMNVVKN